jgi:hypothetical protein
MMRGMLKRAPTQLFIGKRMFLGLMIFLHFFLFFNEIQVVIFMRRVSRSGYAILVSSPNLSLIRAESVSDLGYNVFLRQFRYQRVRGAVDNSYILLYAYSFFSWEYSTGNPRVLPHISWMVNGVNHSA